jgi:hypothetical protein
LQRDVLNKPSLQTLLRYSDLEIGIAEVTTLTGATRLGNGGTKEGEKAHRQVLSRIPRANSVYDAFPALVLLLYLLRVTWKPLEDSHCSPTQVAWDYYPRFLSENISDVRLSCLTFDIQNQPAIQRKRYQSARIAGRFYD